MIQYGRKFSKYLDAHPYVGIIFLVAFAFLYCLPALRAPFWTGNDAWSNLLPVIHYRDSILNQHTLPLSTDLWYGGRLQWQNPLWNFLYLPSTVIWLIAPLDWGTRIVYFAHFVFALLAGRKLGSLFLRSELERTSAGLILASPNFLAYTAGHTEKILAWGWVLLSLYFLFDQRSMPARRGFLAGLGLAAVPISGANYYALYTGILVLLLALSFRDKKLLGGLGLGSSLAFLHLPGVSYLIGQSRGNSEQSIHQLSMSFANLLSSLSIGAAQPSGWDSWALIGIPLVYLFLEMTFIKTRRSLFSGKPGGFSHLDLALLTGIFMLALLATGLLYRGHHLLDMFRVPARAVSFLALGVALFVLNSISGSDRAGRRRLLLFLAALQVGLFSFLIRPHGSLYGPYDPQAQTLADALVSDGADSVWISMLDSEGLSRLNDMYIHIALNRNGLRLPNVYYGDMGQKIIPQGDHCGYSFDHIVSTEPVGAGAYDLIPDIEWSDVRSAIPRENLLWIKEVPVHENRFQVYRVICDAGSLQP